MKHHPPTRAMKVTQGSVNNIKFYR